MEGRLAEDEVGVSCSKARSLCGLLLLKRALDSAASWAAGWPLRAGACPSLMRLPSAKP